MLKQIQKRGLWIAFLLQILWGLVPSASQVVMREIPIELYISIRWTISGLIFLAYLVWTGQWKQPPARIFVKVAGLGLLGYGVASFGTLYGLRMGGVTNFALMGALNPIIAAVAAVVLLNERPRKLFYFALPLCVVGLALLIVGKNQISTFSIAIGSAGLILSAAFLESLVLIFSKRLKTSIGALEYLTIAQLSAAALMWVMQFSVFHQSGHVVDLSTNGLMALLFVSIVACVFCYAILYWLISHMDGHKLALFDGVHVISATVFGLIFFHEQLNAQMIWGGLLLLVGLVLGTL